MSEYQYPKFLMFGDSITELSFNQTLVPDQFLLGPALVSAYARKLDVLHRGFSGYNSEWIKIMLPKILKYEHDSRSEYDNIKIAYLFIGTNDGRKRNDDAPNGKLHVPLDKYEKNLKQMIDLFLEKKIKLVLIAPGLHYPEKWFRAYPEDKKQNVGTVPEELLKYSETVVRIAEEYKLPYVNMSKIMKDSGISLDDLLSDGVHYTGKSYKLFFDNLMEAIKTSYPEYHPDNIKTKFPIVTEDNVVERLAKIE